MAKRCYYCRKRDYEVCRASDFYVCTRPKGHKGPHVACGNHSHAVHKWPQKKVGTQ